MAESQTTEPTRPTIRTVAKLVVPSSGHRFGTGNKEPTAEVAAAPDATSAAGAPATKKGTSTPEADAEAGASSSVDVEIDSATSEGEAGVIAAAKEEPEPLTAETLVSSRVKVRSGD